MSLRTLPTSALVLSPLKTAGLLLGGIAVAFIITGCSPAEPEKSESENQASSAAVVSSESQKASFPLPVTNNNSFQHTPEGYVGTLSVKGYAVLSQRKEDPEYDQCGQNCQTFTYVFFVVTDGMTDALSSFINRNNGNSYMKENSIGLGCLSPQKTIKSEVTAASGQRTQVEIDQQTSAIILQASSANPVTMTLVRDFEPSGGGAPHCYSHFKFVSVDR